MKRFIILYLTVFLPLYANAQALPFLAMEQSPVAAAKGGASVTETSSTAWASFTNSAAIPFSEMKGDISAGYSCWQPSVGKTNIIRLAGAYNINNKFGVGAGLSYGIMPGYDIYDETGSSNGTFKPSNLMANFGFSWRFIKWLALGVNLGYANEKLAESVSYGAFSTDIFLMTGFKGFKGAVGISNLGTKVTSASGNTYGLPTSLTAGIGYDASFAENHRLDVNLDLDYYFHQAFAAAIGAGYTFKDLVSLRAGYRYGGQSVIPSYASAGIGVKIVGITLDFAYLIASGESPMKNTLNVGLGYRF